jgi:hypothetical protein
MEMNLNKSGKPKNYSKDKKDLATFECLVVCKNGLRHKLEEAILVLSPTIEIKKIFYTGSGNRYNVHFQCIYGPVKGAWASDVRSKVQNALDKVGSTAIIEISNDKRTVIQPTILLGFE